MNASLGNAKWIWHNDYKSINMYLDFYDTLTAQIGKKYTMYISVDSNYALYINGTFVESGQFADYPEYKIYDTLDITPFVKEGKNDIKITAYWHGRDFATYRMEDAGLIYAIDEDEKTVLVSDAKTMVSKNTCFKNDGVAFFSPQIGFSFDYDCKKEGEKEGFKNADIQEKKASLYPRAVKKLEITDKFPAKIIAWGEIISCDAKGTVGQKMLWDYMSSKKLGYKKDLPAKEPLALQATLDKSQGVYFIVDLGAENAGYADFDIEVDADCDIYVSYGEHLDDMRVRAYLDDVREYAFVYRAKKGRNTFFNPLRRIGLRYMQFHVYSKNIKINYAGIRATPYPLSNVPYFKCSDRLHNRIYEVCLDTLRHCMHEHYEDCPWREQALYSMDSRNQMLCGYYTFGEFEFARESLRLFAKSIMEDNFLQLCSPGRFIITIPSFSAIYLTQVYEYTIHSGDKTLATEVFDVMERIAGEFEGRIKENGVVPFLPEKKYWNFYEWSKGMDGYEIDREDPTYDAPLSAFVSMAFRSMSYISKLIGNKEKEQKYALLHKNLNDAINKVFWCEDKKAYYSFENIRSGEKYHFSQLNQALIVYCGACPDQRLDAVLDSMVNGGFHEATLSHRIFMYDALMMRPEKYARLVIEDIADKWGYMLYHNATTFWECMEGADMYGLGVGSLCHGWSATPAYIYHKYAAGLKIKDGEIATYDIKPDNCGLYECESLIVTPDGQIKTK